MEEFKSQKIKTTIKDLLKKKNITYEDLAEELECSIPTVKRVLGPEELTLNRLLQLCEILNIDLAELEILTQSQEIKEERFSEAQETFLAKNPSYFAYLIKLFDGLTPKEIEEKYKLTTRSTDKYLIGLEKNQLIRVTGKQRVKPAFKKGPTIGRGPLARLFYQSLIDKVANLFTEVVSETLNTPKDQIPKSKALFGVQTVRVTKATYDNWVQEHERMILDFAKRASIEEKMKEPSELSHAVVINAHGLLPENHPGLQRLDSAFGNITNF